MSGQAWKGKLWDDIFDIHSKTLIPSQIHELFFVDFEFSCCGAKNALADKRWRQRHLGESEWLFSDHCNLSKRIINAQKHFSDNS